jgi:hypothetical protein
MQYSFTCHAPAFELRDPAADRFGRRDSRKMPKPTASLIARTSACNLLNFSLILLVSVGLAKASASAGSRKKIHMEPFIAFPLNHYRI